MTSPIGGISIPTMPSISSVVGAGSTPAPTGTAAASGSGFADVLTSSIDQLSATQGNADKLAVQAATGDLQDAADYQIASTQATLATDMVVSLRNKGVEAFNEIMRMQI